MPASKLLKLLGPRFRATNCMSHAPYWLGLCRSVDPYIRANLSVVHHITPNDPVAEHVVADILRLTLSRALLDAHLPQIAFKLMATAMRTLKEGWKRKLWIWSCDGSCRGNHVACTSNVVNEFVLA